MVSLVGVVAIVRMPVDLFPAMNIPVVAVATFYSGMPPEQIEGNITYHLERFFTLASGIEHMESRSLSGVSIIKVYFQPGTNPDSAVTTIASLAMAEISHLPPGTLPPFVLKMDSSSLPVCLVTVKGQGLNETQLHDYLQYQIRNQIAGVPGATLITSAALILGIIQIGAGLVLLPVVIWAWTAMTPAHALLFTVYMLPVMLLDNVLRPIVMGRGLSVPMPVILVGVIGGTFAYGITGLFLGPIVLSVMWELAAAWVKAREET